MLRVCRDSSCRRHLDTTMPLAAATADTGGLSVPVLPRKFWPALAGEQLNNTL